MKVKSLNQRYSSLYNERSSWISHWQDISERLLPRSGRFFEERTNLGHRRYNEIYDSSGTKALRILAAGIMAGMTNPSKPWIRFSIEDKDLLKYRPVNIWLSQASGIILDILARSNAYRVLHQTYEELGAFGTSASFIANDFNKVIHLHPFPIGEYSISTNWKDQVDTIYRQFEQTVGALVREFGLDKCSSSVQRAYKSGNLDQWIKVRHCIQPRVKRDNQKIDNLNMAWESSYWEVSSDDHLLRESGFNDFSCVVPRWAVNAGDIYGNSPGMDALGDIKQLQQQQYRKSQAIDYQANPPLQIPSSMQGRDAQTFPGGINYYDANTQTGGIKTAFEVNLNLQTLLADMLDVRGRIRDTFFSDIFTMISQQDQRMTATEVMARNEEKMLMLGPVIERLNNELLDKLITTTFHRAAEGGLLPPPPEELDSQNIDIEYISILAQAQKAVSVNGIDRFVTSVGNIATMKPEVLDKIDPDYWADVYSEKLGIDPKLIIPNDKVAIIRQQRAAAQQQEQKTQAIERSANIAKELGSIPTGEGTAAGKAIDAMSSGNHP